RLGLRVLLEQRQDVDEGAAVDRIAADPHAGGHPHAECLHLRRGFVAERARAGDHADGPARVDVARHDPHHGPARADDASAVRPYERRAALFGVPAEVALHPHHVLRRNAVRDGHDQPNAGVRRLHDRVGAKRRGDENQARRGARGRYRFLHRIEDRAPQMVGAALSRGDASHDIRAVGDHLLGVEGALVAGEALDDDAGLLIEQDAHAALTRSRASTTRSAASERVSAVRIGRPLSVRMRRPSSTFVPASRTTSGTGTWTSRTAWTTPCATQSQRLIPANTFTRMARTRLSESTRRNAAATRSGLAAPPISRKFAGSPAACLIMSIVAMARPSPNASSRAWNPCTPTAGSTSSRKIAAGSRCTISSISMPPCGCATTTIRSRLRSSTKPTYSSRSIGSACSTSRRCTGRPSA